MSEIIHVSTCKGAMCIVQSGIRLIDCHTVIMFVSVEPLKNETGFYGDGEQGWRSGDRARLPLMWPGFESWTGYLKWVVGSRPCSEGFSPGSPIFLPPQKSTFLIRGPRVCQSHDCYVLPS